MSDSVKDFKTELQKLFEEYDVSGETIDGIVSLVEAKICEKEDETLKEKINLQKEIVDLKTENERLCESFAVEREQLIEKAEEYGEMLIEKADAYGELLKEEFETEKKALIEQQQSFGEEIAKEYADNLENYAQYVVEQFVTENKAQLVEQRNFNRMKTAFEAIKNTLQEHSVQIDPSNEFVKLNEEIELRTEKYNEVLEQLAEAKKELEKMKFTTIFEQKTNDLADTQKEKIQLMLEGMSFKSEDEYSKTLGVLIVEAKNTTSDKDQTQQSTKVETGTEKYNNLNFTFNQQKQEQDFSERMNQYLSKL